MKTAHSPRKKPRQSRSHITVDAILDAAARIFVEQGFEGATTNAIADCAGVSVGSLYQYFPNKLALLAALRDRSIETYMTRAVEVCAACHEVSLAEGVRAIVEATTACFRDHGDLIRLCQQHLPTPMGGEPEPPALAALRGALREFFETHRRDLAARDLDQATFFVCSMSSGVVKAALFARPGDLRNGRISEELVAAILLYLTGETVKTGAGEITPALA